MEKKVQAEEEQKEGGGARSRKRAHESDQQLFTRCPSLCAYALSMHKF